MRPAQLLAAATTLFGLSLVSPSHPLLAEPTPPLAPDIPAKFTPPTQLADHERREVMIAMRDGGKLHTVILVPKGARRAPIVLTRTPYNASKRTERAPSNSLAGILFAKPADYRTATQRVYHQPGAATTIDLPIAP